MRRLLTVPVLAPLLLMLLAGCIAPGGNGDDRTDDDRLDIPAPSCDGPAFLNSPDTHYDLGYCEEVTVEGQGITVDAGEIGTLTIRGDDIEVDAAYIGVIDISGQANWVSSTTAIGSVDIKGDRNDVDADGDIELVVISGNDNEVTGGTIGSSTVQGDRNTVDTE